jgi:hypothetical protein
MNEYAIKPNAVADISNRLTGFDVVSIDPGPTGELYVLAVESPADYRVETTGATYARTQIDHEQVFLVLRVEGDSVTEYRIGGQKWNYHHVQPLPNNELLLVCSRCHYRDKDDYDLNGRVFSTRGEFQREFLLGDGIQDVQTTASGGIWVSYFDEGIFGNFGWNEPVGYPGVILWDSDGNIVYRFEPDMGLDHMADCYALNVAGESDVWCYYYTAFPLVRIHNLSIKGVWNSRISGSSGFAIWKDWVLFIGGYGDRQNYYLKRLIGNGEIEEVTRHVVLSSDGDLLKPGYINFRGHYIFYLDRGICSKIDLREVVPTN